MPCYFPRPFAVLGTNPSTGKKIIKLLTGLATPHTENAMACRQCTGCRLERSRQWAVRCVHEMKQHNQNCWLTLTYNNENLPPTGLRKRDIQLFMKRFRKNKGQKIRYYYCGEYGERRGRPHYHVMVFGFDFTDRHTPREGDSGFLTWESEELTRLWPHGHSYVSDASFETAAYTARYIMKKQLGKKASVHYNGLTPEFTDMSRRPGIGKEWWEKNKKTLAATDRVIMRGKAFKPPEYYDKQSEKIEPKTHEWTKQKRKNEMIKNQKQINRLKDTESIKQAMKERRNAARHAKLILKQKKRNYENEN